MTETFNIELSVWGNRYIFHIQPVHADILRGELFYIVTCNDYSPFVMAYDFEGCSGLQIQGDAPYIAKEFETYLSGQIEYHNFYLE